MSIGFQSKLTPQIQTFLTVLVFFTFGIFLFNHAGLAANADQWVQRSVQSVTQLAQGNTQGAVQEAVGSYGYQVADATRLYASPTSISLNQDIPFVNAASPHLSANYQASVPVRTDRVPAVSQNVKVGTNTKYFSTQTSLSPKWGKN